MARVPGEPGEPINFTRVLYHSVAPVTTAPYHRPLTQVKDFESQLRVALYEFIRNLGTRSVRRRRLLQLAGAAPRCPASARGLGVHPGPWLGARGCWAACMSSTQRHWRAPGRCTGRQKRLLRSSPATSAPRLTPGTACCLLQYGWF